MSTQIQIHHRSVAVSTATGLEVSRIERELAAMWSQFEGADTTGRGVTRACALNLIVYAPVTENREQLNEMLDTVSQTHPGRTLMLIADREAAQARLEAYVSTRCRHLNGGTQVCGEQVTIEADGATVASASSAIAPLLVPDVPVFLWWKDIPHYDDRLFNRLAAMSDRVVIDSASFDHPHADLARLKNLIDQHKNYGAVSDLNWGRLTAWRTLLASFWDVAEYRAHLDRIDQLLIISEPHALAPSEVAPKALLMAGWLASRLGWEHQSTEESGNETRVRLRAAGREIEIVLRALDDPRTDEGMLASLALVDTAGRAEFQVALSPDGQRLETATLIGGETGASRVLAYEARSEGQRLARELSLLARDRIYEQALRSAVRLIEPLSPAASSGQN